MKYISGIAADSQVPRMWYSGFNDRITAKYHAVVAGWQLKKFCSPADINTRNEVQLLLHAWQNGTAHFRQLSDKEYDEWDKARFAVCLAQMGASGGDEEGGDKDDDEPPQPNNK